MLFFLTRLWEICCRWLIFLQKWYDFLAMMHVIFSTIDCRFEFFVKFPFGNMLQLSKIMYFQHWPLYRLACLALHGNFPCKACYPKHRSKINQSYLCILITAQCGCNYRQKRYRNFNLIIVVIQDYILRCQDEHRKRSINKRYSASSFMLWCVHAWSIGVYWALW